MAFIYGERAEHAVPDWESETFAEIVARQDVEIIAYTVDSSDTINHMIVVFSSSMDRLCLESA